MRILISAGDYSADIHGESLAREMKKLDPSLHVTALGGVRLKKVADDFLKDMVDMDISGFSQPVKQFFNLKNILQKTIFPRLDPQKLDAVILIDYYGFNIHIAAKAKKNGIPVYYFVSPQVWASRKWRINRLKQNVTKMLVIFPFEEVLYKEHGVPVEFVGNPIMDQISKIRFKDRYELANSDGKIRIGFMPGSRVRELIRHVPTMIQTYARIKKQFPNVEGYLFAVEAISDEVYNDLIHAALSQNGKTPLPQIIRNQDYQFRADLSFCLTASGTATLENALLGIPMVVIYQTSWLTYWIAKKLIQVPYISMANILSGKQVVPELIQDEADPAKISALMSRYFSDPSLLERMHGELIELRRKLGPPGAYLRAAQAILKP